MLIHVQSKKINKIIKHYYHRLIIKTNIASQNKLNMALPEDLFRGSSMAAGPLEEVSSGPSRSEISWLPLQTGSASHTCSSRGSNTPKPPTTFTTSWREGPTHESFKTHYPAIFSLVWTWIHRGMFIKESTRFPATAQDKDKTSNLDVPVHHPVSCKPPIILVIGWQVMTYLALKGL